MNKELKFDKDMFLPANEKNKDTESIKRPSVSYWADVWRRIKENKLAMLGLIIIIILVVLTIIGPYLNHFKFMEQDLKLKNVKPNGVFWFGSDIYGRDIFTRIWHGGRISLFIGFMAAFLDFFIGVVYGGVSGYKGGRIDNIMMRIAEILYSVPYLLTVILLMVVFGQGLWTMIIAMSLTGWVPMARLVRGQVLQLKEQEYVLAAQSMGAKTSWILRKHLIPNAFGPILVNITLTIPTAIFAEATLSFLGLGIPAPEASWGTMASDALASLFINNSYQLFIPAAFISLTMLAFNIFGDGLRDALDPRLRQ